MGLAVGARAPAGTDQGGSAPVLQLNHVTKHFGGVQAVDDVSFDVQRGEILTLLGPSGCGKTTTLRMIIGLERCDAGEIVYDGRVVDAPGRRAFLPTHKRGMGMVFQSYAIWPHMTVAENVAYPLRVRGIGGSRARQAVMQALELVGLESLAARPATQLSGGQQQRVALARSLVFEPKILLLDEPFSNLDAQLRTHMRAELKQLQRRVGVTVLLVTHDQIEALSVSDRIAVMRQGRLEQLGSPQDLYWTPGTPSVRDFLGHTILLEGQVESVTDVSATVSLGNGVAVICRGVSLDAEAPAGAACRLAVRPELVQVHADARLDGPNRIGGRITALLFVGDRYEATVALDIGQDAFVYLPAAQAWRDDQRVSLEIRPDDVRMWAA